jgi:hypothetical protein
MDVQSMPDPEAELPPMTGAPPDDEPQTAWPRAIGIISVIYAGLGLLCGIGGAIGSFFSQTLMRMGGFDVEMPAAIKYQAAISAVVMLPVGLLLLMGGIRLLQRRRSAIPLLKTWAVVRLCLIVVGVLVAIAMMPTSIEFSRAMQEAGNDRLRESGRSDLVQEFDEEAIRRRTMLSTGITTAVIAVYPVFIGFFDSRSKIAEEVATWP